MHTNGRTDTEARAARRDHYRRHPVRGLAILVAAVVVPVGAVAVALGVAWRLFAWAAGL